MDELEAELRSAAGPVLDRVVRLGDTTMRLASNHAAFPALRFFSQAAILSPGTTAEYELWCIEDPDVALRKRLDSIPPHRSYRAACFASGYYATDHFGPPVSLHRFGDRHYVVGNELERVVWPYFVKLFVLTASLRLNRLFLKAACVAQGGVGVLVLGRGSGGKTTLVRTLCLHGAALVTNSHAILDGLLLTGVRSTMRVRGGNFFGGEVQQPALRAGEMLVDPWQTPGNGGAETVRLGHICIVDHIEGREEGVSVLPPGPASAFIEQFSLGLNVYQLEEEMLEHFDHDVTAFGRAAQALRSRVQALADALPCHVVRTDILQPAGLARVRAALGLPASTV